jgi:hypothetical protein
MMSTTMNSCMVNINLACTDVAILDLDGELKTITGKTMKYLHADAAIAFFMIHML